MALGRIGPGAKEAEELETLIQVPETAKVSRDQQPIAFENLREGEQVVVRTEKRDGTLVASSIQIGAAPPPAPTDSRIQKVRQILKMVDFFLQMAETWLEAAILAEMSQMPIQSRLNTAEQSK